MNVTDPHWPPRATAEECRAYLLGAMHDGTIRARTLRISQREEGYVLMVRKLIEDSGGRAWTYREGKQRRLFVVEFSRSFLGSPSLTNRNEIVSYIRGYFDAEGGIPSTPGQPYIYFAQRNLGDLRKLRMMLGDLGIECGRIHNPSRRADPDYWRFYLSRCSHGRFIHTVGSWHPRKAPLLQALAARLPIRFLPDYSKPFMKKDSG